ncbi:MAG TPA: tetratricopeptide repeat protein [Gammaproteobacteria bacterium]|nr:tetratricopeptide repeat protein [Gammaproteobacteria bacterium]
MEGYTSEREQVDAIREWWRTNGKSIVLGLAVGLAGLGGYRYWDGMQDAKAENASINYEQFLNLAAQGGGKEALETGEAILKAYPDSSYARLTGLLLAKLEVDDGKPDAAKTHLQWVIDHAGSEEIAAIAKARMAQLVLAEGDAEAALKLFEQVGSAYGERFAELKGDILARLGRRDEAVKAYAQAQKLVADAGADTRLIELKIEALGLDPKAH